MNQGNYFIELEPRNYQAEEDNGTSDTQPDLLRFSQADEIDCKIVDLAVDVDVVSRTVVVSDFWTLFFDGSKTLEGSGAGCVLIDPEKNKHFLSCRLEFECTNNTAEYEALVQGLRKAIELKVKNLKVYGDSEIIVKQIRNQIHCISPHLKAIKMKYGICLNIFMHLILYQFLDLRMQQLTYWPPQLRGLCPLIIGALLNLFSGLQFQI